MKKFKYLLISLSMVFGIGLLAPVSVGATALDEICESNPDSPLCPKDGGDLMSYVKKISDIMMTILGVLSVVMIVYGGIQYTISAGDAKKIESAKNTILYSVIGLVVAILAGTIVNFVMGVFK